MDITQRTAQRSTQKVPLTITTKIRLNPNSRQIQFESHVNNQAKDHRLRVLFKTALTAETHVADSIYETVTRANRPAKNWQNPTNPQHQQAFACVFNEANGVTVGNLGLNEYEILPADNTIALTMLRCVGEMGDWGYFATPEAQCQGAFTFNYSLELTDGSEAQRIASYQRAQGMQTPFSNQQTWQHTGTLEADDQYLTLATPEFAVTSLKRANNSTGLTVRGYNLSDRQVPLKVTTSLSKQAVNFFEEELPEVTTDTLMPMEIKTLLLTEAGRA